uniref:Odorant receptor n=1 Tax=Anopheles christyi TaxID=43041 RepID=A0A182K0R5_9DIPT
MIPFVSTLHRNLCALERKFANATDQFFLLRYLTLLYAIRSNNSPTSVFRRTLWYCHLSVPVAMFGSYCYKAYWHLSHTVAYSFEMFTVLITLWIMVGAFVRGIIFKRFVLERLERFLCDRTFREDEAAVRAARFKVQLQNNRYLVVISCTLLLETCLFSCTNLISQAEFMLVYKGHAVGGFFTQLLYGFSTCFWGSLYVLTFAFIYVILNVFREEMLILVQSFERINVCFDKYRPCLDTVTSNGQAEAAFWDELQMIIKFNVQRHVELLENLAAFGTILKPFSFVQYYGSFTLIAYYSFILMYKGVTTLTVVYIGFIVVLVVESYLFCRSLSNINDLHSQIGTIMCDLEWYEKLRFTPRFASVYRQVRASFLIIIIRSQTPLSFTINCVGTISMSRLAELLNSSYSLVTLLFRLKNEILTNFTTNGNI